MTRAIPSCLLVTAMLILFVGGAGATVFSPTGGTPIAETGESGVSVESVEIEEAVASFEAGTSVDSGETSVPVQNGSVGTITVDVAFVGTVVDGGTMTVEATDITDGDAEQVDGERVTVTVGGDPVTTATVDGGAMVASVEPAVLDIEPQAEAEVGIHGFETAESATVDIVHEVLELDAGYNLHSVPQDAELVTTDVAAVSVWDPVNGTYDSVTDPAFDTSDDLNRALSLVATNDDARLGYTFETEQAPTPGNEPLAPGWNFIGSNFDISTAAAKTVQEDLVGINASAHDIFTADFSEELAPDDTVGAFEGYWVRVEGTARQRGILPPTYDSESREETLGIDGSDFQVTSLDAQTSQNGSGGFVEVTTTVENQGGSVDTQFVDLLVENDTGGFQRANRTGLELEPGANASVTMGYETDSTTQFNVTVATDDDEMTESVNLSNASSGVARLSAPAGVGQPTTVGATGLNTASLFPIERRLFRTRDASTYLLLRWTYGGV